MIIKKLFRPRTLIAVVAVLVIMIAAYAYAAANTVPPTAAGEGQSITSGYDITNVQYLLTANDPSTISGITFDVAPKDPLAGTDH
jgi:hypothetical protein